MVWTMSIVWLWVWQASSDNDSVLSNWMWSHVWINSPCQSESPVWSDRPFYLSKLISRNRWSHTAGSVRNYCRLETMKYFVRLLVRPADAYSEQFWHIYTQNGLWKLVKYWVNCLPFDRLDLVLYVLLQNVHLIHVQPFKTGFLSKVSFLVFLRFRQMLLIFLGWTLHFMLNDVRHNNTT